MAPAAAGHRRPLRKGAGLGAAFLHASAVLCLGVALWAACATPASAQEAMVMSDADRILYGSNGLQGAGHSLYFGGGGEYAAACADRFKTSDGFTEEFTISFWSKTHNYAFEGDTRLFFLTLLITGDANYIQFSQLPIFSDSKVNTGLSAFFSMTSPVDADGNSYAPKVEAFDWIHQALTYKKSTNTVTAYINGAVFSTWQLSEASDIKFNDENAAYLMLGNYAFGADEFAREMTLRGHIDEFVMYNRALTPAEMASGYNKKRVTDDVASGGLFIYYDFESTYVLSEAQATSLGLDTSFAGTTMVENLGSGGSRFDLMLGKTITGSAGKDAINANAFTMQAPLIVPSTAPVTEPTSDAIKLDDSTIVVKTRAVTESAQDIRALLTFPDGGGTITSGATTALGNILERKTSATADLFAAPVAGTAYTEVLYRYTSDTITSFKDSFTFDDSDGNSRTFHIYVTAPPTVLDYTVQAVEDSPFGFSLECTSAGGLSCDFYVVQDAQNCLYQSTTNYPGPLNDNKGDRIEEPPGVNVFDNAAGVALCYLPDNTQGLLSNALEYYAEDQLKAVSSSAFVTYDVFPIDDIPTAVSANYTIVEDSTATKIDLVATDPETATLGVVINELPSHGKLYRVNSDGSKGEEITLPFSPWSGASGVTSQFVDKVTGVSSFWGNGGLDYHPVQVEGAQDVFAFGDSIYTWSPLYRTGDGGLSEGGDDRISFSYNPTELYAQFGYTEYIEVNFTESVYVNAIDVGENRGMGATEHIKIKFGDDWVSVYDGVADNTIQEFHSRVSQYRTFSPSVCQFTFKTNEVRLELDTKAVPDWNEIDFVKLFGSATLQEGVLEYPHHSVYYEPEANFHGTDTFEFTAYDCPFDRFRASDPGVVRMTVTGVNDKPVSIESEVDVNEGEATILSSLSFAADYDNDALDITITAISDNMNLKNGNTAVTVLPYTGSLGLMNISPVCVAGISGPGQGQIADFQRQITYKLTDTSGVESDAAVLNITINCITRAPSCSPVYWDFDVTACDSSNKRLGFYKWKNPLPENDQLPSDCCVEGVTNNDVTCIFGRPLPENFEVDCSYVVADSPTAIGIIVVLALLIAAILVVAGIFLYQMNHTSVRRTQPLFVIIACGGSIVGMITPFIMAGKPADGSCAMIPFTLFLGADLMYSALITKMLRIDMIFNNVAMQKVVLTTKTMFFKFLQIISLPTIILILHLIIDTPAVINDEKIKNGEIIPWMTCDNQGKKALFLLTALSHLLLIVFGAWLAFKVRNVQDDFQESKYVFFGMYNTLMVCIVFVPLIATMELKGEIYFLMVSVAVIVGFGVSCLLVTVPRIIQLLREKGLISPASVSPSISPGVTVTPTNQGYGGVIVTNTKSGKM